MVHARNAVFGVFALNGLLFASLVARVPDVRADLDLDNASLGLLLLALAVGSLVALPTAGALVARWGAAGVVRSGAAVAGGRARGGVPGCDGRRIRAADRGRAGRERCRRRRVGRRHEHRGRRGRALVRRTIMPRFHAVFSLGAVAGALIAVPAVGVGVPMTVHLGLAAAVALVGVLTATAQFLPAADDPAATTTHRSAWREPRTLLIGVVVLAFALAEGSANDWLALALVDGHDASHAVGVAGFAAFVAAMTLGRLAGTAVLDRWGRAPTLWVGAVVAAAGLLLAVHGSGPVVVTAGIVAWGLGASLGFPVGMSAAADDPARAAARVSVVSTIGYAAFLAGPPLLGAVGDRVGTLESLQVVAVLLVPAMVAIGALRATSPGAARSVEERADVVGGDGS